MRKSNQKITLTSKGYEMFFMELKNDIKKEEQAKQHRIVVQTPFTLFGDNMSSNHKRKRMAARSTQLLSIAQPFKTP